MKHFTLDYIEEITRSEWAESEHLIDPAILRLPASFVKLYYKVNAMHDWWFEDLLIANSGSNVAAYSEKKKQTVQIGFFTGDNKQHIVCIYQNVSEIDICCETTDEVARYSPTGFGRCYSNRFDIADDNAFWHGYSFDGGTIELKFEKISLRKIRRGFN